MTGIEIETQAMGEGVRSLQISGEIDISTAPHVKAAVDAVRKGEDCHP